MNNLVILIGRITKDLELRTTTNGKSALEVNIAVNNGKDDTTFVRTTAFGTTADIINKYCKKGSQIGLRCMIRNNNWEDKEGNKHYDYSFIATRMMLLGSGTKDNQQEDAKEEPKEQEKEPDVYEQFSTEISDEDLPF